MSVDGCQSLHMCMYTFGNSGTLVKGSIFYLLYSYQKNTTRSSNPGNFPECSSLFLVEHSLALLLYIKSVIQCLSRTPQLDNYQQSEGLDQVKREGSSKLS